MRNIFRTTFQLMGPAFVIFGLLPFALSGAETEPHVVSPAELRNELATATEVRRANLEQVRAFFNSQPAKRALESAGVEPKKIERGAASLADDDLARLAERTEQIQEDFAAGALSNLHLTYIVIALAAAVLVLVLK